MKTSAMIFILILTLFVSILSCGKVDLSTDKAKYSFALGHQIGENMKRQEIDLELNAFKAGVAEGISGTEKNMNLKERVQALKIMTQMLNKKAEEKKAEQDAQQTPNPEQNGVE